jgi:hypothetical protein
VPTSVGVQEVLVYPPLCVWIPSVFTFCEETGGFGLLLQFFPKTLWMIEDMGYGKRNHDCPASIFKIILSLLSLPPIQKGRCAPWRLREKKRGRRRGEREGAREKGRERERRGSWSEKREREELS